MKFIDTEITFLNPIYTNKEKYNKNLGNVIQGIAFFKNNLITTQSYNKKYLYFNIFDSSHNVIFNKRIISSSHGQDLSLEITNTGNIYLYTGGDNWKGINQYEILYNNYTNKIIDIIFKKNIPLDITYSTSSISENKKYIVSYSKDKIYIYYKNKELILLNSFSISEKQQDKNAWIQGIVMRKGLIYLLTSNNSINEYKIITIYNFEGDIIKETNLYTGREFSVSEGNKWELEGLAFLNNILYTTVMTGVDGANIKRLYRIGSF